MKIGDRVRYKVEFLRSIGCYAGGMAHANGTITGLKTLGPVILAEIAWDRDGIPPKVNVKNLQKI